MALSILQAAGELVKGPAARHLRCRDPRLRGAGARPMDAGSAGRHRAEAGRVLAGLIAGCLTPVGPDDRRPPGMLTHTCDNLYTGEAPGHEPIWGDCFLLEAPTRWAGD